MLYLLEQESMADPVEEGEMVKNSSTIFDGSSENLSKIIQVSELARKLRVRRSVFECRKSWLLITLYCGCASPPQHVYTIVMWTTYN